MRVFAVCDTFHLQVEGCLGKFVEEFALELHEGTCNELGVVLASEHWAGAIERH